MNINLRINQTIRTRSLKIFCHVVLILGASLQILPFLWTVSTSLKPVYKVFTIPPEFWPNPILWQNYIEMFTSIPYARIYFNSVFVASAHTVGTILTSSLAAYAFARLRFPGRDKIFLAYLATLMVPAQVKMIPTFTLLRFLHILDTYYALILPGIFTAFGTFLLRQFFMTLPKDLEDAALIDGSSRLGIYWRIILPLSRPALAALAIFSFLFSWNDFIWPLIVVSRKELMTIQLGIALFVEEFNVAWHLMMAAIVVATLPMLIVFLLAQKQFIEGITLSGLKG